MRFFPIFVTRISLVFLAFLHVRTFAHTAANISFYNEKDYVALMDFKSKIMDDPYGIMKSWNGSVHFCTWLSVTCGHLHRRVTRINLADSGLVGFLSPFLGNLSFLRELILWNNTFHGKIPPEYGRLFRLQRLNLSMNSLEGEIPANLSRCSNLIYLSIGANNLTGRIPEELGSLAKLEKLSVTNNNLRGKIPPSIGNLTSLLTFSTTFNFLVGDIPESLGQLKSLRFLACGANNLSGIIPPSIFNISSLSKLSLGDNQIHGRLPPSLGIMLPNLLELQLTDSNLSGPLLASLSNASELQVFDMSTNRFSGKIAIDFGGMQNLKTAILGGNNFGSGEPDEMFFLSSMTNCSNLVLVELGGNLLRGVLPKDIGNFSSQLSYLSLAENHIFGAIPSTIGNLVGLDTLFLHGNQLRGKIPSSSGNLQRLQMLALSKNELSGEIPESLGNLTLLIKLSVEQNLLEGAIPPALGNCRNLLLLNLSQNKLSNTIPDEIFRISSLSLSLDLSQNHLSGSLPVEIGELVNLSELHLSENNMSGEIPKTIGRCTSLVYLSIAGNLFSGSIPSSFSSLRGIQILNVSHNNLAGQIPMFLKNFALEILDLSFNDLEGEVPMQGIFVNASIVSVIGNRGLCGGVAELQLPNCHTSEPKKHKFSSAIIISIVAATCLFTGVIWLLYFFICSSKRRSNRLPALLYRRSYLEVTYKKLFKATNGFSLENLIGAGRFGSVYKGIFDNDNGVITAVKVIKLLNRGALKSFMHECEALRNVRHRNLVKIITCCSSIDFKGNDFKALVYEFMPNGSLENWLHAQAEEPNTHRKLDLLQRINITVDVACALDYLHHRCLRQIVHCDIKPSNILLDSELTAHVGDFGLAKFLPVHTIVNDSTSIGIRGSIGYVAPEYGLGTEVSPHGDVYSFGILLLEMMTGKRPTDPMFVEGLNLHKFVSRAIPHQIIDIVDPVLLQGDGASTTNPLEVIKGSRMEKCLISIVQVGLACSVDSPQDRMDMNDVVVKLQSIRNNVLRYRDRAG